ncbi:MAG: hypothetical protein ABI273_09425 [Lacunisphaera sp.]
MDEKARYWISMASRLTAPLQNKKDFGEYVSRLKKHGLKMKPAMQWIKSSMTNSQMSPIDRALR